MGHRRPGHLHPSDSPPRPQADSRANVPDRPRPRPLGDPHRGAPRRNPLRRGRIRPPSRRKPPQQLRRGRKPRCGRAGGRSNRSGVSTPPVNGGPPVSSAPVGGQCGRRSSPVGRGRPGCFADRGRHDPRRGRARTGAWWSVPRPGRDRHSGPVPRVQERHRLGVPPACGGPRRRTSVLDAFHIVKLATQGVDEVRRRVQQDSHGHRGRKNDPLYRIRNILPVGAENRTDLATRPAREGVLGRRSGTWRSRSPGDPSGRSATPATRPPMPPAERSPRRSWPRSPAARSLRLLGWAGP